MIRLIFGILRLSLKALRNSPGRSALTALGIIVGTAIVIIVLSVGAGVRALILNQIASITPETIWIEVQVPSRGSRAEKDRTSGQALVTGIQITTLTTGDKDSLLKLSNIETGYTLAMGQEKFTHKGTEKRATFWATNTEYATTENLTFSEGRFFTPKENESLAQVVVLGSGIKKELYGDSPAVGQNIRMGEKNFRVIGVAEEMGLKFFMTVDDFVYLPIKTAQKKILGQNHVNAIGLKMKNRQLLSTTVSQAERVLRKNHGIKNPDKDDFVVRTMDQSMDIINTVTNGISLLLFSIACISLVVGGVGIMNVMYVAVTERTSEIGLKKAIGASPFAIRFQFLSESIIICLLGGFLGIGLGSSIAYLVSVVAHLFTFDWPFILPTSSIVLGIGISAGVGLVFGYAPAGKAAKMNPIDALRKA
ncbi:ABC transporter permease [Candidatus Peregrinibacteria bacterium]|nr:MAG: ABC transporter permease [Candidatus Peregrinibacteria bacterium]